MLQTSTACTHLKVTEQHSKAQGTLAQAATNNREKEKALRQKQNMLGPVNLYRRLPEPGEALGKRAGRGRGKRHTEAVKRGGPQGSAANATVLIPPLGNAQPGEGGGTQENATRDRGQGRDEEGASRRNCGELGVVVVVVVVGLSVVGVDVVSGAV